MRLKISEGIIFKHFSKKSDLLSAVLEQYALYDNDIFHTAMVHKDTPREAILLYVDSYALYYENYPSITALLQAYDVLKCIPELEEKVGKIYFKRLDYLRQLIETARIAGMLRCDTDTGRLADIFYSACRGICLKWRISGFRFPLREEMRMTVNMLLDAFA